MTGACGQPLHGACWTRDSGLEKRNWVTQRHQPGLRGPQRQDLARPSARGIQLARARQVCEARGEQGAVSPGPLFPSVGHSCSSYSTLSSIRGPVDAVDPVQMPEPWQQRLRL